MMKDYRLHVMYSCGTIFDYRGQAASLSTESEDLDKIERISSAIKSSRETYTQAFAALADWMVVGPGTNITNDVYTSSSGQVTLQKLQAVKDTVQVSREVVLSGYDRNAAFGQEKKYPLYAQRAESVADVALGGNVTPLYSGYPSRLQVRLESEPSDKKTHSFNVEPVDADPDHGINFNSGVDQSQTDTTLDGERFTGNLTGSLDGGIFYHGVRYDIPRDSTKEIFAAGTLTVEPLPLMAYHISERWDALDEASMVGAKYDRRASFNLLDAHAQRVFMATSKTGVHLYCAEAIGAAIASQRPLGIMYNTSIDLDGYEFAKKYWRDETGKKITLKSSGPMQFAFDDQNYLLGTLYTDLAYPTSPSFFDYSLWERSVVRRQITSLRRSSVLLRLSGPYPLSYAQTSFFGRSTDWMQGFDGLVVQAEISLPEGGPGVHVERTILSMEYPPQIVVDTSYDDISYDSEGNPIYYTSFPYYAARVTGSPCNNATVYEYLGKLADNPASGNNSLIRGVPHTRLSSYTGFRSLPTNAQYLSDRDEYYPELVTLTYESDGGGTYQTYAQHLNIACWNFTAEDGLYGLTEIIDYYEIEYTGLPFQDYCSMVLCSLDREDYKAHSLAKPMGDSLAVVLPVGWEGYIIPGFENYQSFAVHTGKTTGGPSGTITSDGAVRFSFGSSTEYLIDIVEVNDGRGVERVPVYRAPEKMLSNPWRKADAAAKFDRYGSSVRTETPSVNGRTVSVNLPQGVKIFVSKISKPSDEALLTSVPRSLISFVSEEIPDGKIPDRFTGTVYVQVVDTYYNEMQQITVNL